MSDFNLAKSHDTKRNYKCSNEINTNKNIEEFYYDDKSHRENISECSTARKALQSKTQVDQESLSGLGFNSSTKCAEKEETLIEKDYCETCLEDLTQGEIVNYCLCSKFYHPNCLIYSKSTHKVSSKACEECVSPYHFANYKQHNQMDSTSEKTPNASLMDTNINNLDNYTEMREAALHMSHVGMTEIISRTNEETINHEGIARIALSPITLNTTPYSGKTKKQISSNQKVEEYIRLQNTHTTPSNYRHMNMSGTGDENVLMNGATEENLINYVPYERSPEVSFQGIRQHLNFCSPNHPNGLNNNNNVISNGETSFNNVKDRSQKSITGSTAVRNENLNLDVDKFFKSVNFELSSHMQSELTGTGSTSQISFRKIVFDDIDTEERANSYGHTFRSDNIYPTHSMIQDQDIFDNDKENSPPVPRESSKYSYNDPETILSQSPVEVNLEAGASHIVSDSCKLVEIPIMVDFRLKDLFREACRENQSGYKPYANYSKDFIVVINTYSLSVQNVFQIFKILFEKLTDNDRVFSNILKIEKWLNKEDLKELLIPDNFESYLNMETSYLNFTEISKLMTFCIDLSFEHHSNIFSVILVNDIDEIGLEVDYLEDLRQVSNKFKESKVNLIKNFTINCITLDNGKIMDGKSAQNAKSVSFFYDLSMLSMGYFFAPKDLNELNKSVFLLASLMEQSALLNVKANIKGNMDPSVYIEVMNYPHVKTQHNNFEIFLGNLMRKERKFINLNAKIILNNQNVSLTLPLLEINFEFMTIKQRDSLNSFNSLNNLSHFLSLTGSGSLIKNKTPYYQISIPIIKRNKEVCISNSVVLRSCCSKIADMMKESLEFLKNFKFEESLKKLQECKIMFEQIFRNQTGLIKFFKLFSDLNNNGLNTTGSSINLNMNNVHFRCGNTTNNMNSSNSRISHHSQDQHDDSLTDLVKSITFNSNIVKIFNFCFLILSDINNLIDLTKSGNLNMISEFFTIKQSLMFYRPVHLSDERFLDDVIE